MKETNSRNHSCPKTRGRTSSRRRTPPTKSRPGQPIAVVLPKETVVAHGVLEMHPNGYGFLRDPHRDYARRPTDAYVPAGLIRQIDLREGVELRGNARPATAKQGPRLVEISAICGRTPAEHQDARRFEDQTAISPHRLLRLETGPVPLSTRVVDLFTPLGLGQRGLIVASPKTGKTTLLEHISAGVTKNHPQVKQVVLLIDERPEEVTDFRCNVHGEVVASSLDEDVENHVRLTKLAVQRCQRLAEAGEDVFLLIDSLTRIARAFNKCSRSGEPLTSGGINIRALDIPKKLFASARQLAGGGSLTILATALIDTGSAGDEVIFQEFKGTGNMEIVLDRTLAERRVWPAIDIGLSGTRRDERLLPPETLQSVTMLRRALSTMPPAKAMEELAARLGKYASNYQFLDMIRNVRLAD
jgi:transcription termination factor Rho